MSEQDRSQQLHRELTRELSGAGCFRMAPVRSVAFGAFILSSYAAAYAALLATPQPTLRLLLLAALAFLNVQAGFLAHEAGHGAVTRNRRVAHWVGQVFNTLLTALCHAHFSDIHRRHHPYCNDWTRDPDMQSEFFSMHPESARRKTGLGGYISRHQAALIWILVWLQGFTLKLDSFGHLRRNLRATRTDQGMLALHFALWIVPPVAFLGFMDAALNYLLMTLLIGPYLAVIFLVNHIGTRVMDPVTPPGFFLHEIAVTRNLGTSRLHDFLFGGVNNHIEHHLFPSMPTARLRTARYITREFCRRNRIEYREMSWFEAARQVTHHLRAMAAYVPP